MAIPGLFAFVVYQIAMVVASVTIVRERELGTLEQLAVTPVRRGELLTGKAIPAVLIGLVNFLVLLAVVVGVFNIPLRGSLALLIALSILFIVAEVCVGLLVSAVSKSQQQAVLVVFPLAMVDLALSGYLVPVESMPRGLQVLSLFSPLRHYMKILKDIMLKGADMSTLWPSALALAGLGAGRGPAGAAQRGAELRVKSDSQTAPAIEHERTHLDHPNQQPDPPLRRGDRCGRPKPDGGRGEIFGLVGPDGAGKTTILRMLAAIMDPSEGCATVAGFDTVEASRGH